jgi:hypothetical protein
MLIPATYDNATKVLKVAGQNFVAAITYGVGAIGQPPASPRTAHSFLPEFEEEITQPSRLSVEDFALKLGDFFNRQWQATMPAGGPPMGDMVFLVAGYNENEPYGRVYQIAIPSAPKPVEQNVNEFGLTYGGQIEITARILDGIDRGAIQSITMHLSLAQNIADNLFTSIKQRHMLKIPYIPPIELKQAVQLTREVDGRERRLPA